MPRRRAKTFLIESYVPQLDERTAASISSRLRAAVAQLTDEGLALRSLRSFALVEEETYFCIVEALDIDDVVQLNKRAALEHDYVTEVVAV